ncbi:hypothetical protein SDC9_203500 [bioreactor metagenome]|uniref:Uncharacterized protein n=1 Tax=bioreactor metagenome TaxID=1076179 RepID=A0A645IXD1_9ZZZZ
MREALGPVLGHHAVVGQELHVGRGVERHHIGVQSVVHGARLGAGASVRLVDLHILAGGLLVVRGEGDVVVLVELARYVVGNVEQLVLRKCRAAERQGQGGHQGLESGGVHAGIAQGLVRIRHSPGRHIKLKRIYFCKLIEFWNIEAKSTART